MPMWVKGLITFKALLVGRCTIWEWKVLKRGGEVISMRKDYRSLAQIPFSQMYGNLIFRGFVAVALAGDPGKREGRRGEGALADWRHYR